MKNTHFRILLEAIAGPLKPSSGLLGAIQGHLGPSYSHLRAILDHLGAKMPSGWALGRLLKDRCRTKRSRTRRGQLARRGGADCKTFCILAPWPCKLVWPRVFILEPILRPPWGLCQACLPSLESHLGSFGAHLGASLGPSWAIFWPSWAILGSLGPFWAILKPTWGMSRSMPKL